MVVHQKLRQILDAGLENLQVVLDFDGTITEGKSLLALFRDEGGISQEYVGLAQKLYDEYRPYELRVANTAAEKNEKSGKMTEWWQRHIDLLVHYGLDRKHMQVLAGSQNLKLKDGMLDLFKFCSQNNIPIIIFSANALGAESINMVLRRFGIDFSNVTVYSNNLIFDASGKFLRIEGEIVHSENKDEHLIRGGLSRPNTILVGDNPSDVRMVLEQPNEIIYRVGISHDDEQAHSETYTKVFDNVIAPHGNFGVSDIVVFLGRSDEKSTELRRLE